jgi:hemolysin activation/secretion protein
MTHRSARLLAGAVFAAAAAAASARPAAPAAPAEPASLRFEIARFDVTGNTLLPAAAVEAAVAPHAGRERDFSDVQRAVEALEAAYRQAGYQLVTVQLPEQELDGGIVRLRVVQAKIGRVTVKGNRFFDEANIRRGAPGLQAGQVPNIAAVSASLKLANENPARQVALKLQGGAHDDEVDATLEVRDEAPWKASASIDNTGSDATGKTRTGFVLQHANLFGRDHVLSLQYTTTAEHPGRVKVYGIGYHVPLYAWGDALDFFAMYSNIDSGSVAAGVFAVAVSGKGAVYGARYTHHLARRGGYESKLVYGIDAKVFRNSIVLFGQQLGNDVTVRPASLAYQGAWALPGSELAGTAALVRNLPGGARGSQDDFTRARAHADDGYTLLRLSGSYSRALPGDWQARALVDAQLTGDALVPGEQFGAGGAASVRGFAEREIASDAGVAGNLELYTPNLCGRLAWQCRALAFHDTARVSRRHALPGELRGTTIAGAGLGLRVLLPRQLTLQLDYGHVLRGGATGRAGANRLHARLGLSY